MHNRREPKLAPPGAGLPLMQRIYARWYLGPFVARKSTWAESRPLFEKLHGDIASIARGLTDEQMARKTLVPPLPGLEDSSRFWSPAMVLEHLVIVGQRVEFGIIELSHGRVPGQKVEVGKVKPKGQETAADAKKRFDEFYLGAPKRIEASVGDWDSRTTLVHPWFGPFNARQWAWLLAVHARIHRRQLREILRGQG
ncbi:MAG TPA: DinB family protein [Bdellovibrionota bacterium]|nr:DinB family protein [Bdellovibrionota bacterium]